MSFPNHPEFRASGMQSNEGADVHTCMDCGRRCGQDAEVEAVRAYGEFWCAPCFRRDLMKEDET